MAGAIWTMPGGITRAITIPATAGNANFSVGPGQDYRWKILSCKVTLVCDANVADRKIYYALTTAGGVKWDVTYSHSTAITASQTKSIIFSCGYVTGNGASFPVDLAHVSINPDTQIIDNLELVTLSINAGVAGDSYSGVLRVLEYPL